MKIIDDISTINHETLNIFTDDELYGLYNNIDNLLHSNCSNNNRYIAETAMCYVQRELQLRSTRKQKHDQFVQMEQFIEDESKYPLMDDQANYEFVCLDRLRKSYLN